MTTEVLDLDGVESFAEGAKQRCFVHPGDARLCVKVHKGVPDDTPSEIVHLRRVAFMRRVAAMLRARPFEAVAGHVGTIRTTIGSGELFELVRDETTGRISRPIALWLRETLSEAEELRLATALDEFKRAILRDGVVVYDLQSYNVVAQERDDRTLRLVAIDGFGHPQFVPLADFVPALAHRTMRRRIRRCGFETLDTLRDHNAKNDRPWHGALDATSATSIRPG